ncbi:MAG: coenzyme F420-0:L-glutamate ligase [Candidatus Cloacimonetes bacterium]|nr:coenzyme F420-0:L-glutamate ligase [Candidatus Cloacimonadota bacterium]
MKPKIRKYQEKSYLRLPVKTRIIMPGDDMAKIIQEYAGSLLEKGDIVTISESPLAITQGRAKPLSEIKPGFWAKILWRFVSKVPYGIGLRAPASMQCAIEECGSLRIIFAALVGGLGRLVGRRGKGDFYRLAGMQAALIDAASTSPVPPYESCVIKGPLHPAREAQRIAEETGVEIAVMDINDIGGSWMIGGSKGVDKKMIEEVMQDNPQGQGAELTPICIVREHHG